MQRVCSRLRHSTTPPHSNNRMIMTKQTTQIWPAGQTVATSMIRHQFTPGGLDTWHSTPKSHSQWCTKYVNAKSAINQNTSSSWIQDPNRPHLNVILDKKHKVKALVDSGSTICLADSSILNHIADKSAVGPAISVTNCHNSREKTQGCYRATLGVDEDLPHPLRDKPIIYTSLRSSLRN